jgi:endoglucanase
VELYRLTGAAWWHDLFLASTSYQEGRSLAYDEHQYEAAFLYAEMPRATDATVRKSGIADILDSARRLLTVGHRGGFGQSINPATPYGYGYTSVVPADADAILIKAYELTDDVAYLRAVIGDAQFGLGANPDNIVYTTGIKARGPRQVLLVDAEAQGKDAPPGITIFGQYDALRRGGHFSFKRLAPHSYPNFPWQWPLHEMVNGFRLSIPITEFSVQATLGPTAFVRGYIAATDLGDARGTGD